MRDRPIFDRVDGTCHGEAETEGPDIIGTVGANGFGPALPGSQSHTGHNFCPEKRFIRQRLARDNELALHSPDKIGCYLSALLVSAIHAFLLLTEIGLSDLVEQAPGCGKPPRHRCVGDRQVDLVRSQL